MRSIIPCFIFIFFISACHSDKNSQVAVGFTQIKTIAFSDTLKKDTFKITIIGNKAEEMVLDFTITAFTGKIIFKKEIKAKALLKAYLASAKLRKEGDKQKFLKEEAGFFLQEENFLEPAVTKDEKADQNTPDPTFYTELKQTHLNGFSYRLGKDTKIYLAWSIKEQKVKAYYKCC